MKKRVKDLNIEINLSKLNNILKNIIDEKYLNSIKYGYVGSSSYSKLIIYDSVAPFIFNDIKELMETRVPSKTLPYDKFLKSDEDEYNFSSFLADLNLKLCEYYGREVLFRIELTKLTPGNKMHFHRDIGRYVKHRINILFEDDVDSGIQCGDFTYNMLKNKLYEVDVTKLHRSVNNSNKDRYALILDVVTNFSDLLDFKMNTLKIDYNKENFMSFKQIYDKVLKK